MTGQITPSNNLDTFRILFIVKGGLNLLAALFLLGYAVGFGFFFNDILEQSGDAGDIPFNFGVFFAAFGLIGFAFALAFGIVTILAAKYMKETRSYTFIFVVAILNCLTGVLGIVLGVFTIIELNKPHVKELFGRV